jgi:hypothetical protein
LLSRLCDAIVIFQISVVVVDCPAKVPMNPGSTSLSEAPLRYQNTSHAQSALKPRISSPRIPLLHASSRSSRIAFQSCRQRIPRASFLALIHSLPSMLCLMLPPYAIHFISEPEYPRPFSNLFFFSSFTNVFLI